MCHLSDYLKTAIKQKGCTLQQKVAEASGMTKELFEPAAECQNQSRSAQKLEALHRFLASEFPRRQRASAWYLVSSIHSTPTYLSDSARL
ncbi:hypothetical protein DMH17_05580 [Raoultella planticola]|nr:hypothetical protein [Raoultella planticola]